ncbi:MAG: electron transport complex subunit RsxE [Mycoplasmatales bacterium]
MNYFITRLKTAVFDENPTFVSFLALCPTLGTTSSVASAFWMGISVIFVLTLSNIIVSMIRKVVPNEVRIPVYITIIATFVTITEMVLRTYVPTIYDQLGIFLPLIVVNCLILGRAEAFASSNTVGKSAVDGLTMGAAFALSLLVLGAVRELIGTGKLFGETIFGGSEPMELFTTPTGAFIAFGILAWIFNEVRAKSKRRG